MQCDNCRAMTYVPDNSSWHLSISPSTMHTVEIRHEPELNMQRRRLEKRLVRMTAVIEILKLAAGPLDPYATGDDLKTIARDVEFNGNINHQREYRTKLGRKVSKLVDRLLRV